MNNKLFDLIVVCLAIAIPVAALAFAYALGKLSDTRSSFTESVVKEGPTTGELLHDYYGSYDQFSDDPGNPSFILLGCSHNNGVLLTCEKMAAKI